MDIAQHSSPIPIPPHSPSKSSKHDRDFVLNPSNPAMENQNTGETTQARSAITYPSVHAAKTHANYRAHSFENISSSQVTCLVGAMVMCASFYGLTYRAFPAHHLSQVFTDHTQPSIAFNVMYFASEIGYPVLFVVGFACYLVLSMIDPGIKLSAQPHKQCIISTTNHNQFWCYLCEEVREIGTKHCYSCSKCVPHFDHHCPFLNLCVGGKNYSLFIAFCALFEIVCCVQIGVTFYVWYYLDDRSLQFRHLYMERDRFQKCLFVSMTIPIIFAGSLMSLLHFHAYLAWKKMSTFDWILQKRQREAKKRLDRMKAEKERQHTHSITLHAVSTEEADTAQAEAVNKMYDEYREYSNTISGIGIHINDANAR
eukprot:237267_1